MFVTPQLPTDISTVNLTVASLSGACSFLIKLSSFDWIGTGSGADASGPGGVATGNKANGGGVVRGIDAGNAVSGVISGSDK